VSFGFLHRVMTDALAVLGLLTLLTSGALSTGVVVTLALALALALAVPDRWQDRPWLRRVGLFGPLALFVLQLSRLFDGADFLVTAVEFAAGLQPFRLATRRGAVHDQQVILLALLHLVAGTVLGGGLAYGLCFLGFLVISPGALVLSHLRREVEGNYRQGARDRTGLPVDVPRILRSRRVIGRPFLAFTSLLSVPLFLFTALLFLFFPRVGLSLLWLDRDRPERMVGFSDRVDLGGVGRLRSDPTIALRLHYPDLGPTPPPRLALYLRGTAFDRYDGRSWSRSLTARRSPPLHGHVVPVKRLPREGDRTLSIDLTPIDPPVVFLPRDTVAFEPIRDPELLRRPPRILAGPEDQFQYVNPAERGLRYRVYYAATTQPTEIALSSLDRARYTALPPSITPRVAALAARWSAAATSPLERAKAIEAELRRAYRYDLESPSGLAENPLDHFLFESRRGHCEFYSTAMAILLRTVGVPTRNVTGFASGTYNRFGGFYAVRQGDAHSWVEVFIDGSGWIRFDPTPTAAAEPRSELAGAFAVLRELVEAAAQGWNRHVQDYDLDQQLGLLRGVRQGLAGTRHAVQPLFSPRRVVLLILGAALLLLSLWTLRRTGALPARPGERPSPTPPATLHAVALYRALEAALAARGVPRQASTPPLAHARALLALGHPSAPEILDLTSLYLEARFGGRPLDDAQRRAFLRRVKLLRQAHDLRSPAAA